MRSKEVKRSIQDYKVTDRQTHTHTSDYLQQQDIDFISATTMSTSLLSTLQEKCTEACFDEYYSKAQVKCNEIGIAEQELPPPRRGQVSLGLMVCLIVNITSGGKGSIQD